MSEISDMALEYSAHARDRHAPEYRQLELYSTKKKLPYAQDSESDAKRQRGSFSIEMAFAALEGALTLAHPEIEGLPSWKKYLALNKKTAMDKVVAEVYRVLRIHHLAWVNRDSYFEVDEGGIRIRCVFQHCSLTLGISPVGMELLESFVGYYLDSFRQPYSEAYAEAVLIQYFIDIVQEINAFSDEDRVLYQFHQAMPFNRHFRFDSDNPRYEFDDGMLKIEIGKRYDDPVRYPIDFYIVIDDATYIIPAEALKQGAISLERLPRWRIRTADGMHLPERFRLRFGRLENVVGLPMT
ncbi:hypothetical protein [Acidithiobacillus sp.]|uniref:hypothetical protein n=1 Tax=Acidithiobacillus sp. TaxID=1872118 RepID=UPI0026190E2E|nr:hypothetical protein [Acidithiobacillus sp.]